jgi:hypothetical protein
MKRWIDVTGRVRAWAMADRRTKQALLDELRMVYDQNDLLRARVEELESYVRIDKITRDLERVHNLVVEMTSRKERT